MRIFRNDDGLLHRSTYKNFVELTNRAFVIQICERVLLLLFSASSCSLYLASGSALSVGALIGIIVGSVVLVFVVFILIMYYRKRNSYYGHSFVSKESVRKYESTEPRSLNSDSVAGTFHRTASGHEMHRSRADTVVVTTEMICKYYGFLRAVDLIVPVL